MFAPPSRTLLRLLACLLIAIFAVDVLPSRALPSQQPTRARRLPLSRSSSASKFPVVTAQDIAARVTWEASFVRHSVDQGYDPSYGGDYIATRHEEVTWRGTAVVHVTSGGQYALPFAMMVSYESDLAQIQNQYCNRPIVDHRHASLTEPPEDMGRPEFNLRIQVQQRDDGSFYVPDPFPHFLDRIQFGPDRYLFGYYTTNHHTGARCWVDDPPDVTTTESSKGIFPVRPFPTPGDIEGDSRGMTFSKEVEVPFPFEPTILVHWKVSIQRLGDCPIGPGPIDGSDPALNDVDVMLGAPDVMGLEQSATLIARVMCNGRPVRNASLEIGSDALPYSGGHRHDNPAHPRPRGRLNGVAITPATPHIIVATNDLGEAAIDFQAGVDRLDRRREIAGVYQVTVRPQRFRAREAQRTIIMRLSNLVEGAGGDQWTICREGYATHPEGTWGSAKTIAALAALADDFFDAQVLHNQQLVAAGRSAWPVVALPVSDISLQDGGLFDLRGDWSPPHKSHRSGASVDFRPNLCWQGIITTREQRDWLKGTMTVLGQRYGAWNQDELAEDPPRFHLEVNQQRLAREAPLPADDSLISPADNPDLSVAAFLAEPSNIPNATAGQVVTYTIAVGNLRATTDAQDVTLEVVLPVGLSWIGAAPTPDRLDAGQIGWDLGMLPAHSVPQLVSLTAQVGSTVAPGTLLTITAQVASAEADADPANSRSDSTLTIQPPGPDLAIRSDLGGVIMTPARPVTFTVWVTNLGNLTAPDTTVTLTLPVSVTLRSASPAPTATTTDEISWLLGSLAPESTQAIAVTVAIDTDLLSTIPAAPGLTTGQPLTYTIATHSSSPDIAPDNNYTQVVKPVEWSKSDAAVWFSAPEERSPGLLTPGQDLTYTIGYGNFGDQIAPSSTITLSLSAGLTLVSAQPAADRLIMDSAAFPGGVAAWDLGDLPSGKAGTIQIQLDASAVPPEGSIATAIIRTASQDMNVANNLAMEVLAAPASPASTSVSLPLITR